MTYLIGDPGCSFVEIRSWQGCHIFTPFGVTHAKDHATEILWDLVKIKKLIK